MPNTPQPPKKNASKAGELQSDLARANQFAERLRRRLATRSTLSRLRNRKSALK
jgi:hypothetical protein